MGGCCRVGLGEVWQRYPWRALAVPRILAENHVPVFVHETGSDADAGYLVARFNGMKTKLVRLELAIGVEIAPGVGSAQLREVELLLRHGIEPGLRRLLLVSNNARNRRRHEPPLFRIQTQHSAAFVDHIGDAVFLAYNPMPEGLVLREQTVAVGLITIARNGFPRAPFEVHSCHAQSGVPGIKPNLVGLCCGRAGLMEKGRAAEPLAEQLSLTLELRGTAQGFVALAHEESAVGSRGHIAEV